jgi:hypothetical protein
VLISVKPAFGFRNLLNCMLQGGANSVDGAVFASVDVCAHVRHLQEGLDSQSPPERISPHCQIETLRCRVQPSATPWQPELRIHNNPGHVLASVVPVHNNSQKC